MIRKLIKVTIITFTTLLSIILLSTCASFDEMLKDADTRFKESLLNNDIEGVNTSLEAGADPNITLYDSELNMEWPALTVR